MARKPIRYFECPHCGARVRQGAAACPECGSDEETGWRDDPDELADDLPTGYGAEQDSDYQDYLREEHPEQAERSAGSVLWKILLVVIVGLLIVALTGVF